MEYSLYELYSQSPLDLYGIHKHFLTHFFYQHHSEKDAARVLRTIVSSSRISQLINLSQEQKTVPTSIEFVSVIRKMWRFMFRSEATQLLAVLDTALRWDIEINAQHNLATPEELRQEMLNVFKKYPLHQEMSEEDLQAFHSLFPIEEKPVESPADKKERAFPAKEKVSSRSTWSLTAFSKQFEKMQVGAFTNKETGEVFHSCVFTKEDGTKTFVSFSSKLGELTTEEIEDMKDDLYVVRSSSGHYSLKKNNKRAWKNVRI